MSETSAQTLERLRHELPRRRRQARRLRGRLHRVRGRVHKVRAGIRRRQLDARERAVTYARSCIGITENPPGSNSGGWITRAQQALGFGNVAWCGIGCAAWLRHAGVTGITSRLASVALIEEDARARRGPFTGWTTDPARARPGDLVVLFGRGIHVGLVTKITPTAIHTIEGNTSSGSIGSQSNGGGVFARARALHDVHGFALVRYPTEAP